MAAKFMTRRRLILLLLVACALLVGIPALKLSHKVSSIQRLYAAGGYVQHWSKPPKWVGRYFGKRIADLLSSPKAVCFDGESGDPAKLNDELLCEIVQFPTLRRLFLHKCGVTGQAFECIPASSQINELLAVDCPIEDESLQYLVPLKHLTELSLSGSRITAESVKVLSKISSLEELTAWDTALDDEDANLIEDALPNCRVLVKPLANPEGTYRPTKPIRHKLPDSYNFE